jgi:hypothetical protein
MACQVRGCCSRLVAVMYFTAVCVFCSYCVCALQVAFRCRPLSGAFYIFLQPLSHIDYSIGFAPCVFDWCVPEDEARIGASPCVSFDNTTVLVQTTGLDGTPVHPRGAFALCWCFAAAWLCVVFHSGPACVYVCMCACLRGQGVHRVDGDACFDASCINEQVRCGRCISRTCSQDLPTNACPLVLTHVVVSAPFEQIYMKMARPLVEQAMRGVHASFLCFGPPASGKTHSLFGNGVQSGVIKRVCRRLFASFS